MTMILEELTEGLIEQQSNALPLEVKRRQKQGNPNVKNAALTTATHNALVRLGALLDVPLNKLIEQSVLYFLRNLVRLNLDQYDKWHIQLILNELEEATENHQDLRKSRKKSV